MLNNWSYERMTKDSSLLYGQPVRNEILSGCKAIVNGYSIKPRLIIITAQGFDDASSVYIRNKIKTCDDVGIIADIINIKFHDTTKESFLRELIGTIDRLNKDENVDGYFIQMPLPFNISINDFADHLDPTKDVDGFSPVNLGKSFSKNKSLVSCTPQAIIDTLNYYNVNLKGRDVVLINRSQIVGIPLIPLLLKKDATVTVCHSKTKDLKSKCQNADVVITAVGIPNLMDETWFKDDAVVIDVSINRDEDGSLCGDVKKSAYQKNNLRITPVPKGIGVITTANVVKNVVLAYLNKRGGDDV